MSKDSASMLSLQASHEALQLIAEIDEFKGRWGALRTLSPERLRALRHVATIESIGSSTRIEGVKLTDRQIETLLANLQRHAFKSRDEQEVAGYAEAMDLLFQSWEELTLTENHLKQLHAILLIQREGRIQSRPIQTFGKQCRGIRSGRQRNRRDF